MASNPQAQRRVGYRGADIPFPLVGVDNTDPTDFSLLVTISEYPGGTPVHSTTSVTVSGSGPFTLTFTLSRATTGTTLTESSYFWDLWRTDSGSNSRLAGGVLELLTPERATS